MVKQKNKKTQKNIWKYISLLLAMVIVAAGVVLVVHEQKSKENGQSTINKSTSAADNSENNTRKSSSQPSTTLDSGGNNSSEQTTTSGSTASTPSTSSAANYQVQIVSSNVNQDNLHIGDVVTGTTSGDCTLTATKAGQPEIQLGTSTVKQDVNDYDCGVFNIPTSKFPASGEWTVELTVTNDGTSSSSSVNVNV